MSCATLDVVPAPPSNLDVMLAVLDEEPTGEPPELGSAPVVYDDVRRGVPDQGTKKVALVIKTSDWEAFGQRVGDGNRSSVLRRMIRELIESPQ